MGLAVALLGLVAGAWWPSRAAGLVEQALPACAGAADPVCAGLRQLQADLQQQGTGLQVLLVATAVWLLVAWWSAPSRRTVAPPGTRAGHGSMPGEPARSSSSHPGPAAVDAPRITVDAGSHAADASGTTGPPAGGLALLCEVGRMFGQGLAQGPVLQRSLGPAQSAIGARTVALWLDERACQALGCAPLLHSHGAPARTLDELFEPALPPSAGRRLVPPGAGHPAFTLTVPLRHGAQTLGRLIVEFEVGAPVEPGRLEIAEVYAAMVSQAVAAVCSGQEERRLALMEERGAIAGELHDSLAQSLAYMRIQVAQLQRGLDGVALPPELVANAADLRLGLSNAYRSVRELIAAFRVRMGPGGLRAAVQDTVEELSQRGGLDIAFDEALDRCVLGVNEEFHVMQVIREALSNTVRHAGAARAWVSIRPVGHRLEVTIDDDGRGLGRADPQASHHGLGIMQERARSLGGTLQVLPRPGGGTRVQLGFVPQSLPREEASA